MGKYHMEYTSCEYCGMQSSRQSIANHLRLCTSNPEVANRLRGFFHERATDGCMMTSREYEYESRKLGLPARYTLTERFGNWGKVAEWAGLRYVPEVRAKRTGLNSPLTEEERISEIREPESEGLPVYRALRLLRQWHPKEKRYVPVGWQPVFAVR